METKDEAPAVEVTKDEVSKVMRAMRARRKHESNVNSGHARWRGLTAEQRADAMAKVRAGRKPEPAA